MKRIILFSVLILISANNVFAFLQWPGALDTNKNNFYFTGYDLYRWSGRKPEFEGNYNVIYIYNFEKKERKIFLSGNCNFRDLFLSPNGNYLSVLCLKALSIFNLKGEKMLELSESEPIQEYTWHPDGNKIIYMTGDKTYRGDERVIIPTGIWLYDIKEKTKTKIAEKGWNIRKESFDKHIYFWNGEDTVRYNIDSKKVETTNIKEDVDYSPNGRYYAYSVGGEGKDVWVEPYWSGFRIFNTKENKDLPPEKIGFITERDPIDVVWGKDSRKIAFRGLVSRTIFEERIYIYDLEGNHVLMQFKGKIVGFSDDRTVIVIYRDGEFFLEKIPVAREYK